MLIEKAFLWTTASTLVKVTTGLLILKLVAISFGPSGVGQAGNFRQLITMLGVLTGAGIFNGVTKYVAQYHNDAERLRVVIGTSSIIVQSFSILLAVFFLLGTAYISEWLFGNTHYQKLVLLVSLIQIGIAWANQLLALMKGFCDVVGNALSLIFGNLVSIMVYYVCYRFNGYEGVLFGLALTPALVVIPAAFISRYRGTIPFHYLWIKWKWDSMIARKLSKFTFMTLVTSLTLPIAYMMIRNLLAKYYSWDDVGVWQGINSISDAYLQFITAFFSVYLLPTLSKMVNKKTIACEISHLLRFILPTITISSFIVWLLRDTVILLLFSEKFNAMRDLFVWQQIGDILRVSSYVFGYLVIAKASLYLYLIAEVSQFILLATFSSWMIPDYGALGASQAYMITYIIYFSLCCIVFLLWYKRT